VYTYHVLVNLTLSIDEELLAKARKRAAELGTTVNDIVRDHLRCVVGAPDLEEDLAEFERLSGQGDPGEWKFNREELYAERLKF
jgi:hypothetical protein